MIALTDHMLSLAVINAPLSMLSDSPWFGYNLLIFLAYYLSCVGGYWFMREVTGSQTYCSHSRTRCGRRRTAARR